MLPGITYRDLKYQKNQAERHALGPDFLLICKIIQEEGNGLDDYNLIFSTHLSFLDVSSETSKKKIFSVIQISTFPHNSIGCASLVFSKKKKKKGDFINLFDHQWSLQFFFFFLFFSLLYRKSNALLHSYAPLNSLCTMTTEICNSCTCYMMLYHTLTSVSSFSERYAVQTRLFFFLKANF